MQKLTEFLAMGGYGSYVWPAFLVAALVLAVMAAGSRRALKRAEAALSAIESADDEA